MFSQPQWTNVQLGLMWQVEQDIFLPKQRDHETFQNSASSNLGGFHSWANIIHLGKCQYHLEPRQKIRNIIGFHFLWTRETIILCTICWKMYISHFIFQNVYICFRLSAFLCISEWLKILASAIMHSKSTKQTLVITNYYHNKPINPSDIYSLNHYL